MKKVTKAIYLKAKKDYESDFGEFYVTYADVAGKTEPELMEEYENGELSAGEYDYIANYLFD